MFGFPFKMDEKRKRVVQQKEMTDYFKESPIEPKCLVIFSTHSLWEHLTEKKTPKRKKKTEIDAAEFLDPFLPKDCAFHVILTDGVVGTGGNSKTIEFVRDYFGCDEGLSLIMFSEASEVKFVPFSLTRADCVSLAKYYSEANGQVPPCMEPLMNREIKMINLFLFYRPIDDIDQEIGCSLFRIFNWPLVAGGYVKEKYVRDSHGHFFSSSKGKSCIISGLAICGHNVKVASVLLRSQDVPEVDSTIQSLTEHKFPPHKSFGLMYACVERGEHTYAKQNVESSIFRKYFPNTPLLGFFGYGAVGCNYSLDPPFVGDAESKNSSSDNGPSGLSDPNLKRQKAEMRKKQEAYKMKHPPKLLHASTTVMCLVSLP